MSSQSPNLELIVSEAKKLNLGIRHIPSNKNFTFLSNGKKEILLYETFCIVGQKKYSESTALSKHKNITYYLWKECGIPIPETYCCSSKKDYIKTVKKLKYPVIVKEYKGKKSINIFPNIKDEKELEKAARFFNYQRFVIQEMIFGKEYRVLLLKNKILGCLNMVHPHIVGDGKSSIDKLINIKNAKKAKKIIKNDKVMNTLQKQGINLKHIPQRDSIILLQDNSCLGEGGETIDCTDIIHKKLKTLLLKALKSVNLTLGGIDLICEDISMDPSKQKVVFLEINSRPSLDIHHFPNHGKSRNVTKKILKHIFNI